MVHIALNVFFAGLVLASGSAATQCTQNHDSSCSAAADDSSVFFQHKAAIRIQDAADGVDVSAEAVSKRPEMRIKVISEHHQAPSPASAWSVDHPDSSMLNWMRTIGRMKVGKLTVPLALGDPDSPTLQLTVAMFPAKTQPAPSGPLLVHPGGPGSDYSAIYSLGDILAKKTTHYDVWSISQRGIGDRAHPRILCDGNAKLPPQRDALAEPYKISDFTDCPCALPDGTPMIGETYADVDPTNATQVKDLFEHMLTWKCFNAPKFNLTGQSNKTYNFLQYVGTQHLANDIDAFRKAIGAEKMSIYGASYGTFVAGVYATVYPNNVAKLVMDGNLMPMPQKDELGLGGAKSLQKTTSELLINCKQSPECDIEDPEGMYSEVVSKAHRGHLTAPGYKKKQFTLTPGLLHGFLQKKLGADGTWVEALETLKHLASDNEQTRQKAVKKILDAVCVVHQKPTWSNYDICVGDGQIMEKTGGDFPSPFLEGIAVLGLDLAGRFLADDAMKSWQAAKDEFTVSGMTSFTGIAAALYFWPAYPAPPPPLGNVQTPAVVIGNLFDPSTSYYWTQEMREHFPKGAMVTWQGVGHLLIVDAQANAEAMACMDFVYKYLNDGDLPQDGHTCHKTIRTAVKRAAQPQAAH
jgi:pimeloyl-ACP methyl ester carboxylesterase